MLGAIERDVMICLSFVQTTNIPYVLLVLPETCLLLLEHPSC